MTTKLNITSHYLETELDTQVFAGFGKVITNKGGIIPIVRLEDVVSGEAVSTLRESSVGKIMNIESDGIKALVLGNSSKVVQGDLTTSTGNVPVGENLLRRVVDCLGVLMDTDEPITYQGIKYMIVQFLSVVKVPGYAFRKSVHEKFSSGPVLGFVFACDTLAYT